MNDTKDNIAGLEEAQVHPEAPVKPSPQQWAGLRRVPDKLPTVALLILVVEVRSSRAVATTRTQTSLTVYV